jgi:uncharacterized Zn finger protein (UPF0148 family)
LIVQEFAGQGQIFCPRCGLIGSTNTLPELTDRSVSSQQAQEEWRKEALRAA